ncbi:putative transmembrane protein [Mycena indigotica]|uniref:Putative transmembrane protein n=1 Tax=Mycena indigotica TaxID=2126181 RepID=A0A8H6W6H9_9AGAR|nr:putative transmembrane protein [Mycena indigotica]KAF7301089.1 putative transmembrane protein [Mycena indigotica]
MREQRPAATYLSIFTLECINFASQGLLTALASPIPRDTSTVFSTLSLNSTIAMRAPHVPTDWERTHYYHGISPDPPELLYRSDFATRTFTIPQGRFTEVPIKTVHGVFGTHLNLVWDTVGPHIRDYLKARKVKYSFFTVARFGTRSSFYDKEEDSEFGPLVLWIATHPGTTTVDTAHDVSPALLAFFTASGVDDVVAEWYEGPTEELSCPPLLSVTSDSDPTYFVRHFLTTALGMPIATREREEEGSVAFFFHENKHKDGSPSSRVLGVTNCHVLRKNTSIDYEYKGKGYPSWRVRVAGKRRFQRGFDEIRASMSSLAFDAELLVREISRVEEKLQTATGEDAVELAAEKVERETRLMKMKRDMNKTEEFYESIATGWSDLMRRSIGRVDWAPRISVEVVEDSAYTLDLATFELYDHRFRANFKGNVVDLGAKYTLYQLREKFYPQANASSPFKLPFDGQLRINGWVTKEELVNPESVDSHGEPCLIVMKYGNTSDLTVGRCSGLSAYRCSALGVDSVEVAIWNYHNESGPFAAKGDSGSLVFDGMGRMVGVLHAGGVNRHVSFATPAWWVIEKLRERYPYADFDRQSF